MQEAGVAVGGSAASVVSSYFPKGLRAKVAMSRQDALDDEVVKLKLGDLCRKAFDMGIEIDICGMLSTTIPHTGQFWTP